MNDWDGLSRRATLASLAGAAVGIALPGVGSAAVRTILTPEMFGAIGDGKRDDYLALMRLAVAVSGKNGVLVRFGKRKRYRIDRVQIRGEHKNDVTGITFAGCMDLIVDLNGATIDVKGDFHRGVDFVRGRHSHSNSTAVQPMTFQDCSDVVVRNGSMTGNADRMTRDAAVVEAGGRGIIMAGCSNMLLEDLHIHHFSTDGISIQPGAARQVSKDIVLNRVRSMNNGRQGLTNGGGVGVSAKDCHFSENGFTGGSYHHAPDAGVDIEPNWTLPDRSDFRATRCRFDNNRGSPLVAGNPDRESFVELIDCGGRCTSQRRLILTAERTFIQGGAWHNVQIACAYAAHRQFRHGISIEVIGGQWTGDDPNWQPVYDLSPRRPSVYIHGNRFELRSPRPMTGTYLFNCSNLNHRFEGNEIFVAGSGHDGSKDDLIGQFAGAVVQGNKWSTDAKPPLRFLNNYQSAKKVEHEQFSGSFSGIALKPPNPHPAPGTRR